ncbi:MAG: SH3 domain-containing protein [Elusimicrobiota bacterium]
MRTNTRSEADRSRRAGRGLAVRAAVPALILALSSAAFGEIASVRVKRANVRAGPSHSSDVAWQAWIHTPLEVLARRGDWVRVRDFEDYTGWIHDSLLDDGPAVVVTAEMANVREGPGMRRQVVWEVDLGYTFKVVDRTGNWLKVKDEGDVEGWIHASIVWGDKRPDRERPEDGWEAGADPQARRRGTRDTAGG